MSACTDSARDTCGLVYFPDIRTRVSGGALYALVLTAQRTENTQRTTRVRDIASHTRQHMTGQQ